ncbi:MAG TPA: DUF6600 domain-containing protein, partial [Usitatibacter sp.]
MRALAVLLLSLAALAVPAAAQEVPGRVGRLAWFDGNVALYQDPERGWEEAYPNWPITSRNSVWTDPGARAELQVGPIAVRMDEASQLDVSRLDDTTFDATLERGTASVSVHRLRGGELVRLSTTQATFRLQETGRYRLDADAERGESRLTVFSGAAQLETTQGSVHIREGDSVVVWGDPRPSFAFEDAYVTDFDDWAMSRDERWTRAPEYVSSEMTGYVDLDEWGEWSRDPAYGVVWYPRRVPEDWAPYRYGRWAYVSPWGWTWVDSEPWGYAPFHYGRWVQLHDRWAWSPGRRVERPVWAPALVGFIGGSNWSFSVTTGSPVVGWYPLAPSEPYRPWYRASQAYVNQVNITVINVPQRLAREHREWNRERALTAVHRRALLEQRPVEQARIRVPPAIARSAPSVSSPTSLLPSPREVREAHPESRRQPLARPSASAPAARGPSSPGASATPPPPATNPAYRPSFSKPSVAPQAAPQGAAPPQRNPLERGNRRAPAGEPRQERERGKAPAPQAAGPQGQRAEQERQRAGREAEQNRARAAQEAQQRAEQERQRAGREAEQNRARAAQETQQRAEQERQRAGREAEQNRARAA